MVSITNDNLTLKFAELLGVATETGKFLCKQTSGVGAPIWGAADCVAYRPYRASVAHSVAVLLFLCALPIKSFTKRI